MGPLFLSGILVLLLVGNADAQTRPRKFAGDLSADAFFGCVSDATVADASGYRRDNVEWMFADLSTRVKNLESSTSTEGETIIVYVGNNIFEAYTTFTEPTASWFVPFPEGKGINSVGIVSIGGFPFHSLGRVRYGYGGVQEGIQFSLADGDTWDEETFAIARFMVQDVVPYSFVASATKDVVIPSTLPGERLGLLEF